MKHICCYSGGHSSALTAIEVVRRHSSEHVILMNHDISPESEDQDVKRFKREVANYLGLSITYANMTGWETKDQFDVVVEAGAFKVRNGTELCTNRLKTAPFFAWLQREFPTGAGCTIYYGYDREETSRIQRRASILGEMGYRTAFPLAHWPRTIFSTTEIGISPPLQYGTFSHANCQGCLKAGKQHWYVVYCMRPDRWEKGKWAEDEIGYTIINGTSLEELEPLFERMRQAGIPATERIPSQTFWSMVRKRLRVEVSGQQTLLPCECVT